MTPERKVTAGVLAGAVSALLVWTLRDYAGIAVPAEQAVAITTVITFTIQWVIPNPPKTNGTT
jgi:hypothetical protein